jgi:hypothetical protein
MIPAITDPILLIAAGFIAIGMLWRAMRSRESRVWNTIGAMGWALFALSTFTDGFVQIGMLLISVGVFVLVIVLRRMDPERLLETALDSV